MINANKALNRLIKELKDSSPNLENSIKNLYYPSVNIKNFQKYKNKYYNTFGVEPSEITILTYDALGLIYYIWNKKNYKISSVKDFMIKDKIKGKIGTFSFVDGKLIQKLNMYKVSDKKFIKY